MVLLGPVLQGPDYIADFARSDLKVVLGVILDLVGAGAFVGLAVVLHPVLKQHDEPIALGYMVARSFEAVPFIIANISLLSLLTLGRHYVEGAGFSPAANEDVSRDARFRDSHRVSGDNCIST